MICDRNGLPITVEITAGQVNESPRLIPLVDQIEVPSRGAPKRRPQKLVGDKGCSSDDNRRQLRLRRIAPVIAHRKNESGRRREPFDRESYRERNIIERLIGWLKEARRIATRYEKLAIHYLGMLKLGMIHQYLKNAQTHSPDTA